MRPGADDAVILAAWRAEMGAAIAELLRQREETQKAAEDRRTMKQLANGLEALAPPSS